MTANEFEQDQQTLETFIDLLARIAEVSTAFHRRAVSQLPLLSTQAKQQKTSLLTDDARILFSFMIRHYRNLSDIGQPAHQQLRANAERADRWGLFKHMDCTLDMDDTKAMTDSKDVEDEVAQISRSTYRNLQQPVDLSKPTTTGRIACIRLVISGQPSQNKA
ncbi:hypothetical protein EK21DRAFT_113294 [Setomelanomma holmii]|uniref:Uncharacterized protein n=1 Tax=Setomelanomma holmii TaxID=210430 RepID=A0A9P4H7P7_9PLEO|nr:hypothetical protein EK21DRAFT_113294 [Setomelanomma holmii]